TRLDQPEHPDRAEPIGSDQAAVVLR
ncbi:MAG: hypothetical protein QOE24_2741, partial [Frankiales bacterium]|nr:hypothetical protein [Frankiales bacterium]